MSIKNLLQSEARKYLEDRLDSICQGNEGDAVVKKMDFNTSTGILEVEANCKHKHVWKTGLGKVTAYNSTSKAGFKVNTKDPASTKIKVSQGTPVGDVGFEFTVGDILPLL